MKKIIPISLILFFIFFLTGCSNNNDNNSNNQNSNVNTSRISTTTNNAVLNTPVENNVVNIKEGATEAPVNPNELSMYSSGILDKDPNRQNNIEITCSKLNGTIINPGETFSFCDIVRKGYY